MLFVTIIMNMVIILKAIERKTKSLNQISTNQPGVATAEESPGAVTKTTPKNQSLIKFGSSLFNVFISVAHYVYRFTTVPVWNFN